jgi:hypothetical protein
MLHGTMKNNCFLDITGEEMKPTDKRPTSIRIFLADGIPDGLRIVEKSNWTGRAVVVNRSQIDRALGRDEMSHPGVYVLHGLSDEGVQKLYIGEADILRDRIKQHVANKEFWSTLVAFTSTNEGLNKAHIRYIESKLISLAKKANQWEVENATQPSIPPLSEADRADAEWFLSEMLVIFPLLGVDAFEVATLQRDEDKSVSESERDELFLQERGAVGKGYEVSDGFVVLQGSRARSAETNSIHKYMSDLRQQLVDRGVLQKEGEYFVFTQDFRFKSPSTAAGVLVGGAANGRIAWKDRNGRTLKEVQQQKIEQISSI